MTTYDIRRGFAAAVIEEVGEDASFAAKSLLDEMQDDGRLADYETRTLCLSGVLHGNGMAEDAAMSEAMSRVAGAVVAEVSRHIGENKSEA